MSSPLTPRQPNSLNEDSNVDNHCLNSNLESFSVSLQIRALMNRGLIIVKEWKGKFGYIHFQFSPCENICNSKGTLMYRIP